MLWVRSWPAEIPPGRRYIQDELTRLVITGHDLATGDLHMLEKLIYFWQPPISGFVLVEWDIAYSLGDKRAMEAAARTWPDEVTVAPYKLYPISTELPGPIWAHSNGELPGDAWIARNAPTADYFGFGMVYLPWHLVQAFLKDRLQKTDPRFTDTNFSIWHRKTVGKPVRVLWEARPVHLHW